MNCFQIIKTGSEFLKKNSIETHIIDSEILLSKVLNKSREEILINLEQKLIVKTSINFKII